MIIRYELVQGKMEFPHSFMIFLCFYTDYITLLHNCFERKEVLKQTKVMVQI